MNAVAPNVTRTCVLSPDPSIHPLIHPSILPSFHISISPCSTQTHAARFARCRQQPRTSRHIRQRTRTRPPNVERQSHRGIPLYPLQFRDRYVLSLPFPSLPPLTREGIGVIKEVSMDKTFIRDVPEAMNSEVTDNVNMLAEVHKAAYAPPAPVAQ